MTRTIFQIAGLLALLCAALASPASLANSDKINVVVTNAAYEPITRYIGGDLVEVSHLVEGYQDPHFVRPKPSLAMKLAQADLFVATGLDLEMWAPALVDQANNPRLRSGQVGYVSASTGIHVIEKPVSLSRDQGGVHVFGNPHIHTSPLNGKVIAENIAVGLERVDPEHADVYKERLAQFKAEIDDRLFGHELVEILGSKTLCSLAESGRLIDFLQAQQYHGKPLLDYLGGWMARAMPLRGKKIVTYHKNWGYFADLFGITVAGYMEPKPGLPPTPSHVSELVAMMNEQGIKVILSANYYDADKVRVVAEKTGAVPVIIGIAPGAQEGMETYFDLFDAWISSLLDAFQRAGV